MQYDFVILYTIFYESVFPKYVITIEPPELLVLLFVSLLVTFDDSPLKVTLVAINDEPPPAPPGWFDDKVPAPPEPPPP